MLIHDTVLKPGNAYERQFAGQIGATHAVAFGHARTGLRAILSALGLRPGDEVVLSPLTCKVVPLTLLSLKLKPVYADASAETLNLDAASLSAAITPATRAILFQHTYGIADGVEEAARVARGCGLPLIEDRAQRVPHTADPLRGIAAVYSNNLLKPLPAASGGMVVTDDPTLATAVRSVARDLPRPGALAAARLQMEAWVHRRLMRPEFHWTAFKIYSRVSAGYSERPVAAEVASEITEIAGVPSERQLREGARWLGLAAGLAQQRSESCEHYRESLIGRGMFPAAAGRTQALFYFPVRTGHKQAIFAEAAKRRIQLIAWPRTTPIYPVESDSQLRAYGFDSSSCPVANMLARELIGLPTHDGMTAPQRQKVIDLLRRFHG